MPNEEDIQTQPNTETDSQVKPETGADATAPAQADPQADSDEVAKWKAMSRKNQKQSEANLKQLQQVQAELAHMKADNARLTVKNTYPQITDDALSLCAETEPDKIAAWAEKYAKLNPIHTGEAKPKSVADPLVRKTGRLAENPEGEFNPKPKKGDAYKRSQERQNARRRNRNKTN